MPINASSAPHPAFTIIPISFYLFYFNLQNVTFSNYLNPTDCYNELVINGLGPLIELLTTGVPFNVLNSLLSLMNHVVRAVYCFTCEKLSIKDCNG